MTNEEFGLMVGCSESMASRMRRGKRRPGPDLSRRIRTVFGFDKDLESIRKYDTVSEDAELFGAFLREKVFMDVDVNA